MHVILRKKKNNPKGQLTYRSYSEAYWKKNRARIEMDFAVVEEYVSEEHAVSMCECSLTNQVVPAE